MLKRTVRRAVAPRPCSSRASPTRRSSATLTLRSGEKVSGDLIDLGGVGFTVRVSGNERQIAQNDVAVIDFTGGTMSDADWAKFTGTTQIVSEERPDDRRLSCTTSAARARCGYDQDRQRRSRAVTRTRSRASSWRARITRATRHDRRRRRPLRSPARSPCRRTSRGRPTGITVRRGQRLTFQTTGEVQLSDDANDVATPDGAKQARSPRSAPMPQVARGRADRPHRQRRAVRHRQPDVDRRRPAAGVAVPRGQRRRVRRQQGQLPGRSCAAVHRRVHSADPGIRSAGPAAFGATGLFFCTVNWIGYPWPTGRTRSTCPARASR